MRHFANWIDGYLEYTQHSEAPDSFHFWTAISVVAGALRRRVWNDQHYFKWRPNFFICFVAPPGVAGKSTTADVGMSLLQRVPSVKFGPNALTWQALIPAFIDAREDFPLPNGTFMPMCAITIVASELGNLLQPGDQSMVNLLTELWDGRDDPFRKRTKKDGEETIENPWINLLGCTTPAWIAENFSTYFVGGGFASRTLFVFADHKRQLVAYPASRVPSSNLALADQLVDDLEQIALLQGPYDLSPAAIEWGEEWYRNHHSSDNPLRLDPRFGGYLARKQTHLHKTAMVLAAARGADMRIGPELLIEANRAICDLEPNMLAVYGEMNREKITDQMAQVLGVIRDARRIRKEALYGGFVTKMGYETFSNALNGLIGAGMVRLVQEDGTLYLKYGAAAMEEKLA